MLPQRNLARGGLAALALVAAAHLAGQWAGADAVSNVTQWFLMPLLAGVFFVETTAPRGRLGRLTLLALGFSWLGDTAPDLTSGDAAFLVMVGFFLVAQLVYIAAFWPSRGASVAYRRRWWLLPYLVAVGALVAACAPHAGGLLVPVLVYGLCLGLMAVLATGVNLATAVGGALFLVSDGLIALGAFAPGFDLPRSGFWVMLSYILAQVLIVAGIQAAGRSEPYAARIPEHAARA